MKNDHPIRLRPHHGLCLSFYQGKGYSEAFTDNMTRMQKQLLLDPPVELRVEPDCICHACPNNQGGACISLTGPEGMEKARRYDRAVLKLCDLKEGDVLSFLEFDKIVKNRILDRNLREEVCGDCQWTALCR